MHARSDWKIFLGTAFLGALGLASCGSGGSGGSDTQPAPPSDGPIGLDAPADLTYESRASIYLLNVPSEVNVPTISGGGPRWRALSKAVPATTT